MSKTADLHIHTTASDGSLTPSQVVETAARVKLAAIAVTDHDTVDGVTEALGAGRAAGVEVVPGVEISTTYENCSEVHVLGYFIDHLCGPLRDALHALKNARFERGRKMVQRLNEAGIDVSFERVSEIAQGGAIGRPHVARALCEIGAASSMDSAFGRFLQPGGIGYVPRQKVSPVEAVRLIVAAGGVACVAHPGKVGRDELVVRLIGEGLRAVEAYHPDHSPVTRRFYARFAEKHGLIAVGGSDAHCFEGSAHCGIGGVTVPYEVVDQLRAAAARSEAAREPELLS